MQPGEAARREHGKQDYFEPKWQLTKMKMQMKMMMMLMMKMRHTHPKHMSKLAF